MTPISMKLWSSLCVAASNPPTLVTLVTLACLGPAVTDMDHMFLELHAARLMFLSVFCRALAQDDPQLLRGRPRAGAALDGAAAHVCAGTLWVIHEVGGSERVREAFPCV